MAKRAKKAMTAGQVQDLLRSRYSPPAYAYLEEVRNRTGYGRTESYADGIAMSLWPSRGLTLDGFEIKVSRSDVLKELRSPEKSVPVQQYCDHWWLVLGDASLIQPGELPATWGLMVVRGTTQLRAVTPAPALKPKPLDITFVASVLRNFEHKYVPRRELEAVKNAASAEVEKRAAERIAELATHDRRNHEREVRRLEGQIATLEKSIAEFEERSGVELRSWNAGNLGDAAALLRGIGASELKRRLEHLVKESRALADGAETSLRQFERMNGGS